MSVSRYWHSLVFLLWIYCAIQASIVLSQIGETKGCDPVKHPLITRKAGIVNWVTLHALFQALQNVLRKGSQISQDKL